MGLFMAYLEEDCLPIERWVDQWQRNRALRVHLPRVVLRVSVHEVEKDSPAQLPAIILHRKNDRRQIVYSTSPRPGDWGVRSGGRHSHERGREKQPGKYFHNASCKFC